MRLDARSVLVVAAHPDDEALGCGGTIARLAASGAAVHLLFVADGVGARGPGHGEALERRRAMGDRAAAILGAAPPAYLDFPDNRLDGIDLLDVIRAIERHAAPLAPDLVLTHFAGDLNVDHRICAQAVVTAFRPTPGQSVGEIWGFEVASSTEWAFGAVGAPFVPALFVDISAQLPVKLAALEAYGEEMRPFPHPRSPEAIGALARVRGATAGVTAAEAFSLVRAVC
ncbi:MAG: PIG-L deacetylase family protein [Allosphingosinicella sp.]